MSQIFQIPPEILYILQTLNAAGYPAYLVGGCVRDFLLGKAPGDFDITTAALPAQTMALFARTIPTGLAHGTVTVLYDGVEAEVTTFRKETGYSDHRHPDAVVFTAALEEDLARRDFTVNAMAMDAQGQIHDPYGGRADLAAGILRCVGDPDRRFAEDALRMLRGLRFAAQLGFTLDADTRAAVARHAADCVYVAAERVQVELRKTLLSPRPELVGEMISLGLLTRFLSQSPCPDLTGLAALPTVLPLRYARLLYELNTPDPEALLRSLKLDKVTIRAVSRGVAAARAGLPADRAAMKQLMSREDLLTVQCANACGDYDGLEALRNAILASNEPYALGHLAISGRDLQPLGIKGTQTGAILRKLLDAVIHRPILNDRDTLLDIVGALK